MREQLSPKKRKHQTPTVVKLCFTHRSCQMDTLFMLNQQGLPQGRVVVNQALPAPSMMGKKVREDTLVTLVPHAPRIEIQMGL